MFKILLFTFALLSSTASVATHALFKTVSLNIGSSFADYESLIRADFDGATIWYGNNSLADYKKTQKKLERNFVSKYISADVSAVFLQEVMGGDYNINRPFLSELSKHSFTIFYPGNPDFANTAIALRTDLFENFENHSFIHDVTKRDVTIINATHKESHQLFTFVSLHVQGFAGWPDPKNGAEESGDDYAHKTAEKLLEFSPNNFVIIGGDFNATPTSQSVKRFEYLQKVAPNILEPNYFTNYNPDAQKEYRLRKLDYFMASESDLLELNLNDSPNFGLRLLRSIGNFITKEKDWFDSDENFTDHRPIFAYVCIK